MDNTRLPKKVQIVLASILIIFIAVIVVGKISNNKIEAASPCPQCGSTHAEIWVKKIDDTYHGWFYKCAFCGITLSDVYSTGKHTFDSDGICIYCKNSTSGVYSGNASGGGSEGGTEEGYTYDWFDSTLHTVNLDGDFYSREEHTSSSWADQGDGTHWALCDKCGGAARFDHTEVIDVGKAATCTQTGLTEGKHCADCNAVIVAQQTIPALGHTEVVDAGKAATCTTEGLTEGKHCSVCNEVIVAQQVIPALGHTEVVDPAVAPTCTTEGKTEGKHCSVCGETIVEQEVIPALGHTEVIDEGKEATCTEEGLTEGKHCSVCGEILVAQEKIPAKGHNFEDGECTECGEQEFDEIDISSDTYEIENENISKIQPETTVKEFKDKLQTNAAEINIYNKENEPLEDDDIIGTGMKLELKSGDKTQTFTLIVKGDVNGDGKADMLDITTINQYRLNKASLEEIYLKAGDVTEDGKVDLYDILKINMYRLHKINEL